MLGIRAKIVLPFTLLFLVTILVVAFLAARGTARSTDERIQAQMTDLAGVLSQAGFASNPSVLARVKTIVGGELAAVGTRGAVLASTLDAETATVLSSHLAANPPTVPDGVARPHRVRLGRSVYRVTFAPVQGGRRPQGAAFVYLFVPEAQIQEQVHRATRPVVVAAACGALVVALIGYLVGCAIARPVQALASQARDLSVDNADSHLTATTHDEVAELATAFNSLLDALREAEAKVVAAERLAAVGQVAAGIAHEVRNPLSGIKMSAQVLARRLKSIGADADESVDVMLAEIARLEVIIDDLLTFAGPTSLAAQPSDLNAVVGEVLDFMARQLDHAGVAVSRELADGLPLVPLDPRRIRQVVLNLVLNALEAMPNGGTLTVRTRATDDAMVAAEFDDTGHGVPPDVAPKVFDPFYTTKRGGSGLGLGVSRTLVEAHGGTLAFEPLDPGTRFAFTLPIGTP